ncbi:Putative vacuolar protein sorting-associated protein Vta1 [Septoria linicola]|uniref:Vacuolar protein sorting-associated protein Vta1 n=1 Tax=Septoria linicola TaxID=215465 RepID=A0A9Q9EKW8_9PEZI|nr:putative vacuolar protein sorting-associated protein Vta1 [Septoria linicola]USW54495.1 Putative vacuolar protein sorting-associated protein Vta1 [Septoria linicola]
MAALLPATLKAAAPDAGRFATRAAQLEKFRPIVAYWCEYYILQIILNRQLHTTDEECTNYAMQLMDKLESYKAENAANDAVVDDVAAKAYIENFALETFHRADEAQRNNKVTKQTADTFQASATFMDLLTIWGQMDQEFSAKSKFAKFHALRIAKAIKAGEDPNASNPVIEEPAVAEQTSTEDDLEAELKNLENDAGVYRPPTVESVPDSRIPSRPQSTFQATPLGQPTLPTIPLDPPTTQPTEHDVSPVEQGNVDSRAGSVGGGYFPAVPGETTHVVPPPAASDPADFYNTPQPPPSAPSLGDFGTLPQDKPKAPTPSHAGPPPPVHLPTFSPPPIAVSPTPAQAITTTGPPSGGYNTDDEAIMAAQKHAKWAISALNFEDVNTAVSELRIALRSLGAS